MSEREVRIQSIGRTLLESARREEARLAREHRWEHALLDWCMQNPELRTRIFRFIDVFPQLDSPSSVYHHIKEYFPQDEDRIPAFIRRGLALARPAVLTRPALYHLTAMMFRRVAGMFVAAPGEEEALAVVEDFSRRNVRCSVDILGERTLSEAQAAGYFERYRTLIRALGRLKQGRDKQNISVKLSSLTSAFDPADPETVGRRVRERLRELVRLAKQQEVFLHIDMEEYAVRDLTLKIVRDLLEEKEFAGGLDIGVVLQAYLKDVGQCLDDIFSWALDLKNPLTIRLVRGAYWDYELMNAQEKSWPVPVFLQKSGTDEMFERLTRRILEETPRVRLAVATHNVRSIAHALALAEERQTGKDSLEFQLLYGMGAPLVAALLEAGHSPRVYMPVGEPIRGMAYLVRRLLENVSSQSFVRRGIHEQSVPQDILKAPAVGKEPPALQRPNEFVECPPVRLFDANERKHFRSALDNVRDQLGRDLTGVIAGHAVEKKQKGEHVSPIDGKTVIARTSYADAADAEKALTAAAQSFPDWAARPVGERAEFLRRTALWMQANRYDLAALEVMEVGKPWREADADVKEAVDFLNFYAVSAEALMRPQAAISFPHERNEIRARPRGVAAVIAPWNFPIAILTGMSAAALVTGNPVVIKPAGPSVFCGWKVYEAYREAGIPAGVVHFLPGRGELLGPLLVEDPRTALIAFTGSRSAGLDILRRAGESTAKARMVKKVIAELGGKNAAIVDDTADFDQAVPAVLSSAFGYAGQKCSALSRLIVVDRIYESFLKRLIEAAADFPAGNPVEPLTLCGPVINAAARDRIQAAVEEGRTQGVVLFEGRIPEEAGGFYVPPVIVADLPADSRLLREEIFGPVLAVIRARDFKDALQKANDSDCALTAGVFSRTPSHIELARREFEAGNLYINRPITGAVVGRHPFGGYKMSGTCTKAGGESYLREFFIERTISENAARHGFAPFDEGEIGKM